MSLLGLREGARIHRLSLAPSLILATTLLLTIPLSPASGSHEHQYVALLQSSLVEASADLSVARLALHDCLSDPPTCVEDPEPFLVDIVHAKLGLQTIQARLRGVAVPPKYDEIHELAIDALEDMTIAMDLLLAGIQTLEVRPIELATAYMETGREKIETVYEKLAQLPPEQDVSFAQYLWPLLGGLVAVVAVNIILSARSLRRYGFRKKASLSVCPYCSQEMKEWQSYPIKVVQGWMSRHIATYHSNEG